MARLKYELVKSKGRWYTCHVDAEGGIASTPVEIELWKEIERLTKELEQVRYRTESLLRQLDQDQDCYTRLEVDEP